MAHDRTLFTAGQFARLHNINKRTLHYYDNIGLFSPAHKAENGYRYYTYLQSPTLEMLLALRELDMSIDEIAQYMAHRSAPAFSALLRAKSAQITGKIKRLKEIQSLLSEKQTLLAFCDSRSLSEIELVECPEESLLLSGPLTGTEELDDSDFVVLMEHMQALHSHRLFNKSYGTMIATEKIAAKNFDAYDCFFTRVEHSGRQPGLFRKPGGTYLRAFCKGSWDKLPQTYDTLLSYAAQHGLVLKGYCYEEGINEMAIDSMDEYITKIMVLCEAGKSRPAV